MSGAHSDVGPELRQLAQTILDKLDPAVRAAAAMAAGAASPGKCQQVWCPLCALAALASGEQHPLLTVISEHSVALLTMIRAIIEDTADSATSNGSGEDRPPEGPPPPPGGPGGGEPPPGPGRYQHIPVTVEE